MDWRIFLVTFVAVTQIEQPVISQTFIEHLDPPVVQRGKTNRIRIHGNRSGAPQGLWTTLPGSMLKPHFIDTEFSGYEADLAVPAEAPLGIYGLRLATASGLSNVHLFVVEELPVIRRGESGPSGEPQPLDLPVCVTSAVRPASVDRYEISVAAGQTVSFEVVGNRLGKDFDPLIQIRNQNGKLIAECDNSGGMLFDCRFQHQFQSQGRYFVEVRDARFDGNLSWHYLLRMGDFPGVRVALPSSIRPGETNLLSFPQESSWQLPLTVARDAAVGLAYFEVRRSPEQSPAWIPLTVTELTAQVEREPNNSGKDATPVSAIGALNGVLGEPGDVDVFAFELTQGQKLFFQGVTRLIGSPADLELVVLDPDLREVRRQDDVDLDEASFAFTAGKAGTHYVRVSDMSADGGDDFAYRVDITKGGPRIELLAETSDFTVPRGSYQPLPIKVIRHDFKGEIQLQLTGAPPGIRLEPTLIPADVSEFVARIVCQQEEADGLYQLQIVGSAIAEDATTLQTLVQTKPLVDRQLKNVDLIPYALREDQRLLPPSVTNQLALMITAPAPFELSLPDRVVKLTRYQTVDFPIVISRTEGFGKPLQFTVKGGQIGDEKEERNQVYARFEPATSDKTSTSGRFYNRILTNLNKHRVELTGRGEYQGYHVNLVRTFTLEVQSAFQPTYDPPQISIEPGGTARIKLLANRVPTYQGEVTFTLGPQSGFQFPESVIIPKDQASTEIEIKAATTLNPGRQNIRAQVAGFVGKYEESFNAPNIEIEVKKADKK